MLIKLMSFLAEFFYKVSQKCADGVDTLKGIYDGVKNVYRFDSERYNCAARTESEYVSVRNYNCHNIF